MTNPQTTEFPIEKMRQSIRNLLDMCARKYGKIDCPESIDEIVIFCRDIYHSAREHEREDNYGIANQN